MSTDQSPTPYSSWKNQGWGDLQNGIIDRLKTELAAGQAKGEDVSSLQRQIADAEYVRDKPTDLRSTIAIEQPIYTTGDGTKVYKDGSTLADGQWKKTPPGTVNTGSQPLPSTTYGIGPQTGEVSDPTPQWFKDNPNGVWNNGYQSPTTYSDPKPTGAAPAGTPVPTTPHTIDGPSGGNIPWSPPTPNLGDGFNQQGQTNISANPIFQPQAGQGTIQPVAGPQQNSGIGNSWFNPAAGTQTQNPSFNYSSPSTRYGRNKQLA